MSSPPPGYRYRGLIWPGLLILIGGIALLVNTNVISSDRLYRLGDLWPVLVIVIGLELLVMRAPMPANASAIAAALIILVAVGGSIAYVAAGPESPTGLHTLDRVEGAGGIDHASLQIDVGAATLKIRTDSDPTLFRAHIEYQGPAPDISLDRSTGHVEISQNGNFHLFGPQHFVMDLQLNATVKWSVAVHSGASNDTYDFTHVLLTSLEDDTGASHENITLGAPKGTVPITINGGALTVNLRRPSGTAADVKVSGGAVTLTFDGHVQHAVGSAEFGVTASDMFAVRVNGGACTVTMDQVATG
ncbi:MAG TPA: DUF5668 domain-containing protein [Candidatus Dormibacteraeota bacterium]